MSCLGGGSSGSGELRRLEAEKQAKIKQGLAQINAVFGGGSYGVGPVEKVDPQGSYFTAEGKPFVFDAGELQRKKYLKDLTTKLFTGTQTSTGFTPAFYAAKQKTYEDYALPVLGEQYKQLQSNVTYDLANRGLLGSSVVTQRKNELERELQRQKQQVADTGLGLSQDLQRGVEDERGRLISQLQASADPSTAGQQAIATAQRFSAPSPLPPLGNFFNTWSQFYLANRLGNQAAAPASNQQSTRGAATPIGSTYWLVNR